MASGLDLAGGMDKKESPGLRGVENSRSDGLAAPTCLFPAWLDVEHREPRIVIGKDCQSTSTAVELFGQIAQADTGRRDVANPGGGKETTIGDVDRGVC